MHTRWKLAGAAVGLVLISYLTLSVFAILKPVVKVQFSGYSTNRIGAAAGTSFPGVTSVWASFFLTNASERPIRYFNFRCATLTATGWQQFSRPGARVNAPTLKPFEGLKVSVALPQPGLPVRASVDYWDRGKSSPIWDRVPRWLYWSRTNHSASIVVQ
jgi:hypothetical protein